MLSNPFTVEICILLICRVGSFSIMRIGCHMTNAGLNVLCESLSTCPLVNLHYLRLHWNSITMAGMKEFSRSILLGVFDSLEVLDLSSLICIEVLNRESYWRKGDSTRSRKHPLWKPSSSSACAGIVLYCSISLSIVACGIGSIGMKAVAPLLKQFKELQILLLGSELFILSLHR